jgi:hypothetical protein
MRICLAPILVAAINLRNQSPTALVPQFGHILDRIGQSGSDGALL